MTEINSVATAPDLPAKKAAYEALVTDFMSRPTFARQMFFFWRDTFKMGGTAEMDTAAAFAASLSANNGAYTDLFTAKTGACPTINEGTGVAIGGTVAMLPAGLGALVAPYRMLSL